MVIWPTLRDAIYKTAGLISDFSVYIIMTYRNRKKDTIMKRILKQKS